MPAAAGRRTATTSRPVPRGAAHHQLGANDAVFAKITFHAAYEPQRAVRTRRYKYIRRFDNGHDGPVLANIDDSPSKDLLVAHGLGERSVPGEELYDLPVDRSPADPTIVVQRT